MVKHDESLATSSASSSRALALERAASAALTASGAGHHQSPVALASSASLQDHPSLEQVEAPRLSFNTSEDAINYAAKVSEEFDGWLAKSQANIVEAYKNGQVYLLLRWRGALTNPTDWPISVRSGVVHLVEHRFKPEAAATSKLNLHHGDVQFGSQEGFVLLKPSQLVECPEGVIPSSVWLARGHKVKHLFGNVSRPVLPLPLQVGRVIAKGEVSILAAPTCRNSDEVTGMVEGVAQVDQRITSQATYPVREGLREPQESEVVSWIKRIVLSDDGVRMTLSEAASEFIEFIDVSTGVLD
jgi:hypothetical protein